MSESLNADGLVDADLAAQILTAKATGDYKGFTDADGNPITNWGMFKKALRSKDKHNLGVIVSGHANADQNTEEKGKDKGNGKPPKKDKPHGNPHTTP